MALLAASYASEPTNDYLFFNKKCGAKIGVHRFSREYC